MDSLDVKAEKLLKDISIGNVKGISSPELASLAVNLEKEGYTKFVKGTPRDGLIYEVTDKGKEYLNK